MSQPPVYGIPNTPHVRTGHMFSYMPGTGGYADVKTSDQRRPAVPPVFQAKQFFYDVAYPYWQWPWHNGPFVQAKLPGMHQTLARGGYVGAPLPLSDYNFPTQTAYTPRPY